MRPIGNVLIKDFISDALIVEPLEQVSKIVGLMEEKGAYEIFSVLSGNIGTVTMRDLLKVKALNETKIDSLLNHIPSISSSSNLLQAARLMADYKLRAIPIMENNKLIGKIDVKEIVKEVMKSNLGRTNISKIMTPSPVTIESNEKVGKARSIMIRRRFDHLPVLEKTRVVGTLTSSQIMFNLISTQKGDRYLSGVPDRIKALDYPVEAILNTNSLECGPERPIREVADKMLEQNLSYSLVTIGEELQGIVTYRDFAKLVSSGEEKSEIPIYMVGLPEDPFEAEAARIKFMRIIEALGRTHQPLIEARSNIKSSGTRGSRRRYEVSISIRTPRDTHNYTSEGWELPSIYDDLADKIKKIMNDKSRRRRRERLIKRGESSE